MLGMAFKRMGKKEEALKFFNQALTLTPNDFEVLNNIGNILYEQEKYEKAAEQFLKSLQIKPEGIFCRLKKYRCRNPEQPGKRPYEGEEFPARVGRL